MSGPATGTKAALEVLTNTVELGFKSQGEDIGEVKAELHALRNNIASYGADMSALNECIRGKDGLIEHVQEIDKRVDGIKKISYLGDAIIAGISAGMSIVAGWFGAHK